MMALPFKIYRLVISPAITALFDIRCRYEESCSQFMERQIHEKGFFAGLRVGFRRFLSCNPWGLFPLEEHGHNHLPEIHNHG